MNITHRNIKLLRYYLVLIILFLIVQSCAYSYRKNNNYVREKSIKEINYGYHYNPKGSFLFGRWKGSGGWYDSTITHYKKEPFTGTSIKRTGWNKYGIKEYKGGRDISYTSLNTKTGDTISYNYSYQNKSKVIRFYENGKRYWIREQYGEFIKYYAKYYENGILQERDSSFIIQDTIVITKSTKWDEQRMITYNKIDSVNIFSR